MAPKIIAQHVRPPIPDRSNDWRAWYDGHEDAGPYGAGPNESAAILDLIDNYDAPGGE